MSGVWDVVTHPPPNRGESLIHSASELEYLKDVKTTSPTLHMESHAQKRVINLLEELQPVRAGLDVRAGQRNKKKLKNEIQKGSSLSDWEEDAEYSAHLVHKYYLLWSDLCVF